MKRILFAAILAMAASPAWAGTLYYSNAATDWGTNSTWTPSGVPGAGDKVIIKHAVSVSSNQTVGLTSLATPPGTSGPTFATTGGSTTSLATGTYVCRYTNVDSGGNESSASPASGGASLTSGTSAPLITLPALPSGAVSRNIYITKANGSDPSEYQYATGVTGTTYSPTSASYVNGTVVPGSLTAANLIPLSSGIAIIASGSLSITSGTLTTAGDVLHAVGGATVTMSAGTGFTFKPAAGGALLLILTPTSTQSGNIWTVNGSSGSRCTVKTDLSNGGGAVSTVPVAAGANDYGFLTATYTDFTNFGSTSTVGIPVFAKTSANTINVSNCTFTGCSLQSSCTSAWNGSYTFQYNKFSSSVNLTSLNGHSAAFSFVFGTTSPTTSPLIDSNMFDSNISNGGFNAATFTNNYVNGYFTSLSGSWPSDAYWKNNLVSGTTLSGGAMLNMNGSIRDSYLYNTDATNPHFCAWTASGAINWTCTGLLLDAKDADGTGDCILPPGTTSSSTFKILNCIAVPNATDNATTPGKLISNLEAATSTTAITIEHNTYASYPSSGGGDANVSICALDETNSSYAGEIASCRANLAWSPNVHSRQLAISSAGAGTPHIDAVTIAGFNAFWNPTTGSITANGSSVSAVGYNAIKVSGTYGLTSGNQIGYGDIGTVGTGLNPNFVDSTRNLGKWGQVTLGASAGSDNGYSETFTALITSGPTNLATNIASLMSYVRAGFAPQANALINASYSGDPSTVDAAGNAWPGGGPGIGAMGWTSTAGGAALLPAASAEPRRPRPPVVIRLRPFDRIWRRAA